MTGRAKDCEQVELTIIYRGQELPKHFVTVNPDGSLEALFDGAPHECSCDPPPPTPIKLGAKCVASTSSICQDSDQIPELPCIGVPEFEVEWFFALAGLFVVPVIIPPL